MTLLLVGSILLIAGSAAALVVGWLNAEETYIWTSIAATVAAAVLLTLAFFRSRGSAAAVAAQTEEKRGAEIDPAILADRAERSEQKYARATTRGEDEGEGAETQVIAPDAPPPDGPSADAPATGDAAPGAEAATGATVGPPAGGEYVDTVVAVPKTKKFHRSDCRFASAKNTETLSRSEAESRGFDPCGACKP